MQKHIVFTVFAVSLLLVSCGSQTFSDDFSSAINSVSITAAPAITRLPSASTITLNALVSSIGKANNAVDWTIVSPQSEGGSLSAKIGSAVIYTTPTVTKSVAVIIRATSSVDPTKFGEITLNVIAPVVLKSASATAQFQNNVNTDEYYICGNRDQTVTVNFNYSGEFTTYRIIFSGELNPNAELIKGPFTFDSSNGDTSTAVSRKVVIATTDIKPSTVGVRPQAVTVTPVVTTTPIPPQTGSDLGLGAFRSKVELTGINGVVSASSTSVVRVLGSSNKNCP